MSTPPTCENISRIDDEEAEDINYEETVLSADTGTVTFRDYGDGEVWLGLRRGNEPNSPPEILIALTQRQQETLFGLFVECGRMR